MTLPDASQPECPGDRSALADFSSHLRLWPVAAAGLALDLWTKHLAFTRLPADPNRGYVVIPHLISLQRSLNTGALFGLGKGLTPVFIVASLFALGFVVFLFAHSSRRRWSLHVGLGLVLAGALGNLHDRAFEIADVVHYTMAGGEYQKPGKLTKENDQGVWIGSWPEGGTPQLISRVYEPTVQKKGVVRDFIRLEPRITIGQRSFDIWPGVFNIADSLLVAGVGLLMLNLWRARKAEKARAAPPPVDTAAT